MELWNQANLLPPPTFTFKVEKRNIDLGKLRNAIQDAMNHFKDQGFLSRETALLSRIVYRMKMKFRSAKDFKSLEKVSHALDRYFKCNINSYFKLLLSLIPRNYGADVYLPTKNMFFYVLVKLQGLAKLMERIHDSCKIAAYLTNKRMSIGHFWKLSVIVYSLISRIYILVKYNCQFICDLYAKLFTHSKPLNNPGAEWLPKGYELPADLREWLGVQWVYEEEYVDLTNDTLPNILDIFDLSEIDDDVEFCDEYVLVDEENELNDFRKVKQKKLEKSLFNKNKADRREEIKALREKRKQAKKEQKKQTMRGFLTDIDCGEIITIDESFTDNKESLQQVDSSENQNEEVFDENSVDIIPSQSVGGESNANENYNNEIIPSNTEKINSLVNLINNSNKGDSPNALENGENFTDIQENENGKAITVLDDSVKSNGSVSVTNTNYIEADTALADEIFDHGDLDVINLSDTEVLEESDFISLRKDRTKPKTTHDKTKTKTNNRDKNKNRKRKLSETNTPVIEKKKMKKTKKSTDNIVSSTPIRKKSLSDDDNISFNLSTVVKKKKTPVKIKKSIREKSKNVSSIISLDSSGGILELSNGKMANKSTRKRKRKSKVKNVDIISGKIDLNGTSKNVKDKSKSKKNDTIKNSSIINLSSTILESSKENTTTTSKTKKKRGKSKLKGNDCVDETVNSSSVMKNKRKRKRRPKKQPKATPVIIKKEPKDDSQKKVKRKGHFANKSEN